MRKNRRRFFHKIIAIILCIFCSLSMVACVGGGGGGSGKGSDLVTKPETPKPSMPGTSTKPPDISSIIGSGPNIEDYNEVFKGVIAVYEVDQDREIFYDKFSKKKLSFENLIDRQFGTMASYIYDTLNGIYGDQNSAQGSISGYTSSNISYKYGDTISTSNQRKISGLDTGTLNNKETLNYKKAINGGYAITYKTKETTDSDNNTTTTYEFDKYGNDLVSENAWTNKNDFTKEKLKKALMQIYINYAGLGVDESDGFSFTGHPLLVYQYVGYKAPNNVDYSKINSLGLTKQYMWHVAYYIAYGIIGQANIENSINAKATVFNGNDIKPLSGIETEADMQNLATKYQQYKGYDIILKEVIFDNLTKLAVPSSGNINFGAVDYYGGANSSNTMFPRLGQNSYVYYDNIDNIADVKPSDDENYDYDSEEEPDHTLEGSVKRLKELIYIPKITNDDFKDGFVVDTIYIGAKSAGGDNFSVNITFNAVYDDENKVAVNKSLIYSSEYDNVSGGYLSVTSDYDDLESLVDGAMYTDNEKKNSDDYKFKDAVTNNGHSIDDVINNSFHNEDFTVMYSDQSDYTYTIGRLCVYNDLFISSNGELKLNFIKNYLTFKFDYRDSDGSMSSIPEMYLMYWTVESE